MSVRPTNDEEQGLATIRAAVENGVTLIDTADAYCRDESEFGHNEVLIAKALAQLGAGPDDVLVATKGGHTRIGGAWNARRTARVPAVRRPARRLSGSVSSRSGSTSSTGPTQAFPTPTASAASRHCSTTG